MIAERNTFKISTNETITFDSLYRQYAQSLKDYFGRNGIQQFHSDDLVHEVFYRILKYNKSFRKHEPFKPWLYTTARNVMNDHFKSQKRHPLAKEGETANNFTETVDTESETEKSLCLKIAMEKMEPADKELLVMHRFHKLSYAEIGKVLGISEANARVKAHRALNKLRIEFFQQYKED